MAGLRSIELAAINVLISYQPFWRQFEYPSEDHRRNQSNRQHDHHSRAGVSSKPNSGKIVSATWINNHAATT